MSSMANKAAAIDIGTNSTKMTVAGIVDGRPRIEFERSEVTRLGKGVDAAGSLQPEAIERTLAAVVRFAEEARTAGAEAIIAAGTSALRDARNGREFLDAARERARVDVEIVDGDREAQLAYKAVRYDDDLWGADGIDKSTGLVVFDIGGGSTELIVGGAQGMDRYRSLNIGAVRLTERFIKSDPPTAAEIASVEECARKLLAEFDAPGGTPAVAGIGGTAVNIAAVLAGSRDAEIHGRDISRADVERTRECFQQATVAERREIPGLEPERADVIVAGAVILDCLLDCFGAAAFRVSTRGLRYGLLAEYAAECGTLRP